jgi:hypothetical protein
MADIRAEAMRLFADRVMSAVHAYVKANKDTIPGGVADLAPYFDPPTDPDMLARYEVVRREGPAPAPDRNGLVRVGYPPWSVQNAIATDVDYETRYRVGSNGSLSAGIGPFMWEPNFRERYLVAARSFAQAHQGTAPSTPLDAAPYFSPPLDRAVVDRLIKVAKVNQ